jgi:NCAIR mutase (PurE)-related protein
MDAARILDLLRQVESRDITPEQAVSQLRGLPYSDLGIARVDHHRSLRQGMPEVVFGESKTAEQIILIAGELLKGDGRVLVTRVQAQKAEVVREALPALSYDSVSRTLTFLPDEAPKWAGLPVAIVTAGTSDLAVAEEAMQTLRVAGVPAERVYDAGVAGLHRIVNDLPRLQEAPAVIVVAGMEGALPSVVGGLVRAPIVAVPTSIGYGAALSGFTALLGMLSSCASGLTVVNIDNGFGAAMAVIRIINGLKASEAKRETPNPIHP